MANAQSHQTVVARFASHAHKKLCAIGVKGEPEDQIRAPLERLVADLADLRGIGSSTVVLVGESSIADLKTRPDYAVQRHNALVGFIEVKAPGKGGDPRKFKDKHDKDQWAKLKSLPNLMYTDGNQFSLWRDGEIVGKVVQVHGDITADGDSIDSAPGLDQLVEDFLGWEPIPPKTPKQLAELTARLCRLMREEVAEQIDAGNPALTELADEWRTLLFPEAGTRTFADGYAQAVTFGLLVARARGIDLSGNVTAAANKLGTTHSLIGTALLVLTINTEGHEALKTSIGTLTRVLDVVDWAKISKGNPEAWLYFYEEFLSVYDPELRRKTGSYYTPPEVVTAMVGFVDDVLRTRLGRSTGLAASDVTVVDPAVGTGTFLLAALRSIAETTEADQGAGAVPGMVEEALHRLIGFEIQLGPFAVAQLRLLAELADLGVGTGHELRMYVTDTLANPYVEDENLGILYEPIAESRRRANALKKDQPVLVVIGNPPYKEKAKGRGGWIEAGSPQAKIASPLAAWMPPKEWGVGAHSKHLRNLYVYFWRWATWKVFDHHPDDNEGIVAFITVAGFLNGPGFQKMRGDLRRKSDEIWVIDCSPEGHQPEVSTRIFQDVQQPVCIVLASRSEAVDETMPARVRFRSLEAGHRNDKFRELGDVGLDDAGWTDCADGWRDPFAPAARSAWAMYPALTDYFVYDGSGVMPGRTWVIAPDVDTLRRRWAALTQAGVADKEVLFHPHLRGGKPGDRHVNRGVAKALPGHEERLEPVAEDAAPVVEPVRYGYRTLDRQWIIPDARVINQPNPGLWAAMSHAQLHLTAFHRNQPTGGPAATVTPLIPDLHHYKGSFGGRAFPLWLDHAATISNVRPGLLTHVSSIAGEELTAEDVFAYLVGVVSHPGYTDRFSEDLATPGLRVPLTRSPETFSGAVSLGRRAIWLFSFGERYADPDQGRTSPPRLPGERAPRIPADGEISTSEGEMADELKYDPVKRHLSVGSGYIEKVTPAMWSYEVSGKSVLTQWFSYRRATRERPSMGDRRPPSELESIRPHRWLPEYTTELLNLLHIIGLLRDLEPAQQELLDEICSGPLVSLSELDEAGALALPKDYPTAPFRAEGTESGAQRLF